MLIEHKFKIVMDNFLIDNANKDGQTKVAWVLATVRN